MTSEVTFTDALNLMNYNKSKLYMPTQNIGKYSIDHESVNILINLINEDTTITSDEKAENIAFIQKLISIFKYVDFKTYLDKIKLIVNEFYENYTSKSYSNVYFIAEGLVNKSNTWVMMLFMSELNEIITKNNNIDLFKKIKILSDVPQTLKPSTLVLYFDDMSYSGRQISSSLFRSTNFPENIQKGIDFYITAPYISKTAINKFEGEKKLFKLWNNTEIIQTFRDQFIKSDMDKEMYKNFCVYEVKYYRYYMCHETIIPIYFDHKIADGLSVFQKFLYFGSRYTKNNNYNIVPLIKNCAFLNKANYLKNKFGFENGFNFMSGMFTDIEDEYSCPQTYYKQIKYEFPNIPAPCNYKKHTLVSLIFYYISHCPESNNSKKKKIKLQGGFYENKYLKYKNKYIELKKTLKI